jgi:hypothetical protein
VNAALAEAALALAGRTRAARRRDRRGRRAPCARRGTLGYG